MPETKMRILVVEDDFLVAEMIEGVLEECGYLVIGKATDGREAVNMTLELKPDAVLMDVHLPVMSGLEASSMILRLRPTPIVVLTAYEHKEVVEAATRVGVGAFLVKPPNANSLRRAISQAIAALTAPK
jgi:response regulator NasT